MNKEYEQLGEFGMDNANEPMVGVSGTTGALTPTQLYLLQFFSRNPSEENAKEVKEALFQYYQQKMDKQLDELWDDGTLNQTRLDQLRSLHIRDILKQ